jgi:hypothetical protein
MVGCSALLSSQATQSMSSGSTPSLLSYPVSQPEPSTSTSRPRSPPPRELLKNRLYVGNLHPTVDECVLVSSRQKRSLTGFFLLPQIHPHTGLLEIWEALPSRLSLSQDRCSARQAPRLRLCGVRERRGKWYSFTLSRREEREQNETFCAHPGPISSPPMRTSVV